MKDLKEFLVENKIYYVLLDNKLNCICRTTSNFRGYDTKEPTRFNQYTGRQPLGPILTFDTIEKVEDYIENSNFDDLFVAGYDTNSNRIIKLDNE